MTNPQGSDPKPPRWMEWMMRAALRPRDRDTVSGDLIEEYREEVFPAKGRWAADFWYLRQALSLINGAWFGVLLGVLVSGWMVVGSLVFVVNQSWDHLGAGVDTRYALNKALFDPLAFNSTVELVVIFVLLYLSPVLPGFWSRRHGGKIAATMMAGALASFMIFSMTAIAGAIRMNIVLEIIRNRPDWHQALMAFAGSGGLTARANYYYAHFVPTRILINTAFGAVAGTIGGLISEIGVRQPQKLQNV